MDIDTGQLLALALSQCAFGLPLFLVWIIAGVLIALRIENHRTAAFLALAGIALGIVEVIGGTFISAYVPFLSQQGMSIDKIGVWVGVAGLARAILAAISWGLVLAALVIALGKRDNPNEMERPAVD